jgi:hypothetical protein
VVSLLALIGIGLAALGLVVVCLWGLLRRPKLRDTSDETIAFERTGPEDGELIHVAGRVAVERPAYAPSGTACALYEVYGGDSATPARAVRRKLMPFLVDDGTQAVRIDPAAGVIAFDLPAEALEQPANDDSGAVVIERRLEPGARVQVSGRVRRIGAPGHEEFILEPPEGSEGIPLTWLAPA